MARSSFDRRLAGRRGVGDSVGCDREGSRRADGVSRLDDNRLERGVVLQTRGGHRDWRG